MYIDELDLELNATKLGCKMGGIQMNDFSYADDMVILAPSMKALRKLISTIELYAMENDIIYNIKKTEYMIFKPSSMRTSEFHVFIWKVIETGVAYLLSRVHYSE